LDSEVKIHELKPKIEYEKQKEHETFSELSR